MGRRGGIKLRGIKELKVDLSFWISLLLIKDYITQMPFLYIKLLLEFNNYRLCAILLNSSDMEVISSILAEISCVAEACSTLEVSEL